MNGDFAGFEERLQACNHGHDLHAVVGRAGVALRHLFAELAKDEHRAIATRSRISFGGSISVDLDMFGAFLFRHASL